MSTLFKTKSVSELMKSSLELVHQLKPTLGALNLVTLGIGAIIGAGLFSITGMAAANHAGRPLPFRSSLPPWAACLQACATPSLPP